MVLRRLSENVNPINGMHFYLSFNPLREKQYLGMDDYTTHNKYNDVDKVGEDDVFMVSNGHHWATNADQHRSRTDRSN